MKNIAVVIPAWNEASSISNNLAEIGRCIKDIEETKFSLLVVDDGSQDNTAEIVQQLCNGADPDINLLCLSRHFGKEAAILAGLEHTQDCDAVIVMDSDLQHPPALIKDMVDAWQSGFQIVEGVKKTRGDESFIRNILVRSYYRIFSFFTKLSVDGESDFKLLDSVVVSSYCELTEYNRFFRGLIGWLNYPTRKLPFDVQESSRPSSSWNLVGLFRYAISSITSFTAYPLQIVTILGFITFLISIVIGGIALFDKLTGKAVDGFTTVILLVLMIGSILMFSTGLIGVYVGKIYDEVKQRPKYVIDHSKSTVGKRE
jgi:glycosyltransferase involved in cell wall biosynthesis